MGANFFETKATGKNPFEAFTNAKNKEREILIALAKEIALEEPEPDDFNDSTYIERLEFQLELVDDGYTGTIIEVTDFIIMPEKPQSDNLRIIDKYGPCACIPLSNNEYLFTGWAKD